MRAIALFEMFFTETVRSLNQSCSCGNFRPSSTTVPLAVIFSMRTGSVRQEIFSTTRCGDWAPARIGQSVKIALVRNRSLVVLKVMHSPPGKLRLKDLTHLHVVSSAGESQ